MTRTAFKLRQTFCALAAVLATAASSQAAIIVTQSFPTPLNGNLVGYTLTAVGTAGEVINAFSAPTLTPVGGGLGIHNVSQAFTNGSTPTTQEHTPGLFASDWAAYDTYFMYNATQTLSAGPNFSETNNGATGGTLGLSQIVGYTPVSGFGTYTAPADASKVVLAPIPGTVVPFMHVVMRAGDWSLLTLNIQANGGNASANFSQLVGIWPEPASATLFGMALIGGFGFIRRR